MMGEKILENYKKQLADRMAREKVENQTKDMASATGNKSSKRSKRSNDDFMQKRAQTYHSNDVPDPDELRAILARSSKNFRN